MLLSMYGIGVERSTSRSRYLQLLLSNHIVHKYRSIKPRCITLTSPNREVPIPSKSDSPLRWSSYRCNNYSKCVSRVPRPYPPDEDISYRCIKKGNKFSIERSSKKKKKLSLRKVENHVPNWAPRNFA